MFFTFMVVTFVLMVVFIVAAMLMGMVVSEFRIIGTATTCHRHRCRRKQQQQVFDFHIEFFKLLNK